MAFVRVNGIVLHYRTDGPADAPPLVLSNSLGTDLRIWDKLVDRLAGRYRIVRYDKRGHGISQAPQPPYALDDHVGDLTGLLDHLGIGRTALVGLSVGGMIAQRFTALHPDRVAALVLSDTAHKIGTNESWNERIDLVGREGLSAILDRIMSLWFTPAFRAADNADYAGCVTMFLRTPVEGYVGTCAALRDADLTASTAALGVPTLCLVGDQDGSTPPELVRSMAQLIRGSEFRVVADAGHIPCFEQPDVVAGLLRGFLSDARYG